MRVLLLLLIMLQGMDFPGGKVMFTSEMSFIGEHSDKRIPCYRILNDDGENVSDESYQQVFRFFTIQNTCLIMFE